VNLVNPVIVRIEIKIENTGNTEIIKNPEKNTENTKNGKTEINTKVGTAIRIERTEIIEIENIEIEIEKKGIKIENIEIEMTEIKIESIKKGTRIENIEKIRTKIESTKKETEMTKIESTKIGTEKKKEMWK